MENVVARIHGFYPHEFSCGDISYINVAMLMPGDPIMHGRGLRQGDPLSPLLFDIAIDPLQHILHVATEQGLLSCLPGKGARFRTSLYADDAAIFVTPTYDDVFNLERILRNVGSVTGLVTNVAKSLVAPIRCVDLDLGHILHDLPAATTTFPMKYLGLPLSVKWLKRVHFQYLEDKAVARITPLNGRYFNIAGRMTLVKSVLTSQTIYLFIFCFLSLLKNNVYDTCVCTDLGFYHFSKLLYFFSNVRPPVLL
jgi:hypothetical protein